MMKRLIRIIFIYLPLGLIAFSLLQVLLFKWVPVKVTPLMVKRIGEVRMDRSVERHWVKLEDISTDMVKAVIAAEDQKFLIHNGFDVEEISHMTELHRKFGKPVRGCSTITHQTAKNCFTWCTRTWLRKGVEAYYSILIEWIWGKKRIIEVYLNIIELGPGIYGVEAAAQKYFHSDASGITSTQAASLACCLPNPLRRTPDWVQRHMATRRAQIIREASYFDVRELK